MTWQLLLNLLYLTYLSQLTLVCRAVFCLLKENVTQSCIHSCNVAVTYVAECLLDSTVVANLILVSFEERHIFLKGHSLNNLEI